ncbi:hypothetical protein ANCDUO_08732 [Ancylostoma duodenale]|uniref:Uncharacterized protein n=1 Tax=Ancylostoma duodenale TaxID=51022 RepID=A0A0C2DF04_9BILA|nr:hypothetical protein ANCDUO_08732 [Ancylostoma duodenale]
MATIHLGNSHRDGLVTVAVVDGQLQHGTSCVPPVVLNIYVKLQLVIGKTPNYSYLLKERTRRWREFRLSTNAFDSRPEIIMRQNAMFLLDLNSSLDCDSKASSAATSGWTINLFPTQTPSPSAMGRSGPIGKKVVDSALFARSSFLSQSLSKTGHASDPGPKALPTSPPAVPMQSLGMDGTRSDEGDTREGIRFNFRHVFSVSDIILQYLAALSSYNSLADISSTQPVRVLPHPWRLCFLAGPLAGTDFLIR